MARVYNFSAGPSMLPESVLRKAADEMLDYQGSGQSVMEMSHRSKIFDGIIKGAEALLRELMNIPDNYKVLFLQGGASTQFAAIPMNFMNKAVRLITLYRVNGQTRHTRKLQNTAMLKSLLRQRMKISPAYPLWIKRNSVPMQIIFISV